MPDNPDTACLCVEDILKSPFVSQAQREKLQKLPALIECVAANVVLCANPVAGFVVQHTHTRPFSHSLPLAHTHTLSLSLTYYVVVVHDTVIPNSSLKKQKKCLMPSAGLSTYVLEQRHPTPPIRPCAHRHTRTLFSSLLFSSLLFSSLLFSSLLFSSLLLPIAIARP